MNETIHQRHALGKVLLIGASGLFGLQRRSQHFLAALTSEVQIIEIASQTVPDEPEFVGQADASSIIEIRPQVTGKLGSEAARSHSA